MMEELAKLFDGYNRRARIYPAVLALSPVIVTVAVFAPNIFSDFPKGAIVVALASCVLYGLSVLARATGKNAEKKLLKKWGGWPTTTALRHRDPHFDPETTARYHKKLAALCTDVIFPSPTDELADPQRADNIYRSVTKQFLELRRGPQYQLVHDENALYGFRRNLYGLKMWASTIALVLAGGTAILWLDQQPLPFQSLHQAIVSLSHAPTLPALFAADLAFVVLLWIVATDEFVLQAAYDYSDALLRTLDMPDLHIAPLPP